MDDRNYLNDNSKNDGVNCDNCEESVATKCGHASFNTCRICWSAYGSFSKIVQNSKGLKVAHINVCSLFPKIDEIRFLLIKLKLIYYVFLKLGLMIQLQTHK